MELAQDILQAIWGYFQVGFYYVNTVQGLLIAAIVAYMMASWRQLLPTTLLAVLVHAIDDAARRFYLHFGFEESPVDPYQLMLLLKDLRKAIQL